MKTGYYQKNILITGGLGFIGSTLAMKLVQRGAQVNIIDALIPGLGGNRFNIEPVKKDVHLIIGNLKKIPELKSIIKKQDYIFNLAGTHSHIDSMKNPVKDLERTCHAQLNLLETCRKYNPAIKIIMAGTRSQYGKPQYLPVDESHPMHPLDINAAHWLAIENYHMLYNRVYNLQTCSLRLSNVYGPRHQMHSPYQGVLNWFIRLAMDGKTISLYGDGSQKRDAVYVDDVVDAFIETGLSDSAWGNVFNIGDKSVSLKHFVQKTLDVTKKGRISYIPFSSEQQRIEPGSFETDWTKIKTVIGWEPKTSLIQGIKQTVSFYKKNKAQYW